MPSALGQNTKHCSTCGETIFANAEICPHCGVRQMAPPNSLSGKNKVVAALLAIFLGSFGIHHFYLGNTFMGVIYLLFFWTAVPGIIGFVEGIIYLTMSDERFYEKYGA